jgi:hypothetical protein
MEWTLEAAQRRLAQIKAKGFIGIPDGMFRQDDGVVGQILEREFGINENNISFRDLGTFELKGIRSTSKSLTLTHKKPERGLNPIEIFNRFGYIRASKRHPEIMKKKMFVTITGRKPNRQGLQLRGIGDVSLDMVYRDEFICEWDLTNSLRKIDQIILAIVKTQGKTNATDELFHYERAFLLDGLKPLKNLIDTGIIVIDFCIDQPLQADGTPAKAPHDRGPHIRVPVSRIPQAYKKVERIL